MVTFVAAEIWVGTRSTASAVGLESSPSRAWWNASLPHWVHGITRRSAEKILRLFEKTFADRVDVYVAKVREFLQFAFLIRVQMRGHFHDNTDEQVSMAVTLKIAHALAFDPKDRGVLRSG